MLLHGPGAYGAQWIRTIPALAATHRVIAPDLPGHGASDFFDGAPTPERVAGWLDDLIECTCTKAPVLVGHTLGGAIAAHFAAEDGRLLAALVLVDTLGLAAFQPAPAFGAALQAFLHAPDRAHARRRFGDNVSSISRACSSGSVSSGSGSRPPTWPFGPGAHRRAQRVDGGVRCPRDSAVDALERIDVPTTLIWGRHDRATPLAVAEAASQRYGWRLEVIDGAADDPTLEQPEAFLRARWAAMKARQESV